MKNQFSNFCGDLIENFSLGTIPSNNRYCSSEALRSLPEGIRHLTSLEVLTISGCSTLKKRCDEERGEDWDKIAHIPKLMIW